MRNRTGGAWRTGGGWRRSAAGAAVGVLAVVVVGCGEVAGGAGDPSASDPGGEATDRGPADAEQDPCRPALGPDAPHPITDGGGGSHPDLVGVDTTIEALQHAVEVDHADVSAGLWLDQDAGEIVVMLTGDDRGAVLADLRGGVDRPDLVVCMDATFTQTELEALQATINEAVSGPFSSGIDTVANRVTASIETDAEAVLEALEGALSDRQLGAIDLDVPPCAEVEPIPDGGVALPGGGSTCSGMGALLTGTLAGDDVCAWFDGPEGQIALAWPRGWWLDADGTVHDHRGEPLAGIGDAVDIGGGFIPASASDADACGPTSSDGVWLVASLRAEG